MKLKQVVFFCALPFFVSAVNILGLMSAPSPSHHNWNRNIFYKLAAKGHNLTILSPDVDKESTPGIHYIWAEEVYSTLYNGSDAINIIAMAEESSYAAIRTMYGWMRTSCDGYYQSKGFQVLLNYPNDFKFDLVLVDYTCEPCLLGFLKKFNYPPTVGLSAFSVPHYTYQFIGGHRQFAYVPHFDAEYESKMNFFERLNNFLLYMYDDWNRIYKFLPSQEAAMKVAFKDPNLPDVRTLLRKIILALCNTHFSIEKLEPLPPNVIPVGGLQIQRQNDILAHPKTKAFISHCGLLGTQEAAWYGIPIVGLPFFADQHRNIRNGVREGTSVHLDYFTVSVESIKAAVSEAVENPKYYQNAQRRSRLFRDQPQKPIDRAIFWIEWVMRHKDEYSVIQLPIVDLGVIVSHSYDVLGFLFTVFVLIVAALVYFVKTLFSKRNSSVDKVKQKRH